MRAVTQRGDSCTQPAPSGDAPRGPALGREPPTHRGPAAQLPNRARPGCSVRLGFGCSGRGWGPPELEGKLGAGPGWAGSRRPGETTCSSGWAQGSPRGRPGRAAPRRSQVTGEAVPGAEFTRVLESTAQATGGARCQLHRLPWGAGPGSSLHRADGPGARCRHRGWGLTRPQHTGQRLRPVPASPAWPRAAQPCSDLTLAKHAWAPDITMQLPALDWLTA